VFLEKPIAMALAEADELIALARKDRLKFTIGYSQRFNPKFAYVRQSIRNGTIGKPVSALVSRHITPASQEDRRRRVTRLVRRRRQVELPNVDFHHRARVLGFHHDGPVQYADRLEKVDGLGRQSARP